MLNREAVEEHQERLRLLIRELPDDLRADYFKLAKVKLKDPDTYAVLNYISIAGLHHFYLNRWARGTFNLCVFVFGLGLILVGSLGPVILGPLVNWVNPVVCCALGAISLVVIALIELPALFQSQVIVQDYNNGVTERLLGELGVGSQVAGSKMSSGEPFGQYGSQEVSDEKNPYRNF